MVETTEFRITKRLQSGENNTIVAYSSNTDKYPDGRQIHEPKIIPLESIRSIWLVLGYVVMSSAQGLCASISDVSLCLFAYHAHK